MTDTSKEFCAALCKGLRSGNAYMTNREQAEFIEALAAELDQAVGRIEDLGADLDAATARAEKADEIAEALRNEMKKIALAVGRSTTDGETDCDWAFLGEQVAEVVERAEKAATENESLINENATLEIRAHSSEARVAALEGALTRIRDGEDAPNMPQLGCGVEDRDLQSDGYGAVEYGWSDAEDRFLEWARNEAEAALSAPPAPATCNDPLQVGAVKESLTTAAADAPDSKDAAE